MRDYLDDWDQYPAQCGDAMAASNEAWATNVAALAAVEAAREVEERFNVNRNSWSARDYLWFFAGVVGGAVTGFTVGAIVVATQ